MSIGCIRQIIVIAAAAGCALGQSAGAFMATGSRHMARSTRLPDGRVLMVGGNPNGLPSASAELYVPTLGRFVATGNLTYPRSGHTSVLLSNGKVLILGGYGGPGYPEVAPAEIYDPNTGIFKLTGPSARRIQPKAFFRGYRLFSRMRKRFKPFRTHPELCFRKWRWHRVHISAEALPDGRTFKPEIRREMTKIDIACIAQRRRIGSLIIGRVPQDLRCRG